ncbi:MAG TPA: serine hydrolase domain-containing protein [Candidatus Kryptonia bacterium]|nr:serine hydrolase domain-containing protein [Candidatus Kryptonia bacterium]
MPDAQFFADSPEQVGIDSRKLDELFARAEKEVRDGLLPSVQIAVARHGKLAGMRTFGSVTHEGRPAAATNDTLYVVFSSTKGITSAAAWVLMQEGQLHPDERVAGIIPEFAANGKEGIRVEQLFTHTSGFPLAPLPASDFNDRAKRLERFARWRLNWEPGTRFEYHPTSSMWVIAELIERRGGMDFREFIRTRVAEPLGLRDLYVGLPRAQHGRVADIVYVGDAPTPEELHKLGFPVIPEGEVTEAALTGFNQAETREAGVPGGGGTMTAADLALFYQGLLAASRGDDDRIWTADTMCLAREVRTGDLCDPIFRKRANRGLGIVIAGDADRVFRGFGRTGSEHMFGHNGAGGQIAWADPGSGISLGYCTNGFDRHPVRQARRSVAISSLAAVCAV